MPETDPPSSSPKPGEAGATAGEVRNLPILVSRPRDVTRSNGESWFVRVLRAIFGSKPSTIRADLQDVLEAGAGGTGFSPKESAMVENILGLRERRVIDVMIPRAV